MSNNNPFHLVKFVCDIQPWLNEVDADRLRQMVIKKHLISDSASIERLKRILSRDGQSAHNEELIKLLSAGGQKTYRVLGVVIEELGYVDRSKEMLSILSHTDEDEKSYGDPFQQREFLTDILPWLAKLPAGAFRKRAQEVGFLTDLQQIEDLKRIERRHGPRTHNEELINIASSDERAGYIELVKAIQLWGNYPDKVDKMNQLLPRWARVLMEAKHQQQAGGQTAAASRYVTNQFSNFFPSDCVKFEFYRVQCHDFS
ncbi:uncharacterized protein LOC135830754 [Sycon ciliatum]|uniref:uncharacterized protein LOC135830754 n=1 Tax=Sycon ciliatum TaxID=27933 RepID=UPI0031F6B060